MANSNNIQKCLRLYPVYANKSIAVTGIVCPIYTVNLGGLASDFGTSGPGSIPGWAPIIHYFFFFFFSFIMLNYFLQVI